MRNANQVGSRFSLFKLLLLTVLAPMLAHCSSVVSDAAPSTMLADGGTVTDYSVSEGDAGLPAPSPATSSKDASLSALSISAGPLLPTFAPATLAYATTAHSSAADAATTVTATARNPGAKITIAGASATSGMPSAPIALKAGATAIDVTVTAADGTTSQHYAVAVTATVTEYLKASNARANGNFGTSVAFSADGNTLAVGAQGDSSNATGVNGNQSNTSAIRAGAVYVFTRSGGTWSQQAYLKASNARASTAFAGNFGHTLALSSDGSTLVVGTYSETSLATGINGNQASATGYYVGAAYVFVRAGITWSQQAYLKASNARSSALFGNSVALSSDGNTLAVGSESESSGVPGNPADASAAGAGAVYVFSRSGTTWSQTGYLKTSNCRAGDAFGSSVALSPDGTTLAVGAVADPSSDTGIDANPDLGNFPTAGAAYVFVHAGSTWSQQVYLKASNTRAYAYFGGIVALSKDGNTLAVGAKGDASNATGVNGNQTNTSLGSSGAAYVFTRTMSTWSQQAYVKASNPGTGAFFGISLSLAGDGSKLVVGASQEGSSATGIDGNQGDDSAAKAGSAYTFARSGTAWSQTAYVKAGNTRANAYFGGSVALSTDGSTLGVGSASESSGASGINGNESDTSAPTAGATYVF